MMEVTIFVVKKPHSSQEQTLTAAMTKNQEMMKLFIRNDNQSI